jgi:hypothetical protein
MPQKEQEENFETGLPPYHGYAFPEHHTQLYALALGSEKNWLKIMGQNAVLPPMKNAASRMESGAFLVSPVRAKGLKA